MLIAPSWLDHLVLSVLALIKYFCSPVQELPSNQGIWIAGYGMSVVDVERELLANENSNMILIRVHLTMHIMHPIICMCVRMSINMYLIDICLAMKQ